MYGLKKYSANGKIAVSLVAEINPHIIAIKRKLVDKVRPVFFNHRIKTNTNKALLRASLLTATSHQYAGEIQSNPKNNMDFRYDEKKYLTT